MTEGYGIRMALQAKHSGWSALGDLAHIWQPSRLKGITVDAASGTPFLAATQVLDMRPIPRKWIALARTSDVDNRFVASGQILVTRSGTVGRATVAFSAHERLLISDDLLRVDARKVDTAGYVYAYLRSPRARAMMRSQHYGHMIKHLEPEHLSALPVPHADEATIERCAELFTELVAARDAAHGLTLEAEQLFQDAANLSLTTPSSVGFSLRQLAVAGQRRRLDATYNNPVVAELRRRIRDSDRGSTTLRSQGYEAWLPNRFLRIPAADGVPLVSSSALFEINPDPGEKIADRNFGDTFAGRVEEDWLLVARSGQNYGLVGSVVMANHRLVGKVISDHVIRLRAPKDASLLPGYVLVALSHPTLGRPLMKALPTGSSIPSIDFDDVLDLPIIRLEEKMEAKIADRAMRANQLRLRADAVEDELAAIADHEMT